jgi:D-threo-aldose 1-dehydrogenase
MLGGVFNSGILARGAAAGAKYNYTDAPPEILERVRKIELVCADHRVPLPGAALHFALAGPAVSSLVPGAVTPDEVKRNVAAISAKVPAGLWADLKSAGLLEASVPTPA